MFDEKFNSVTVSGEGCTVVYFIDLLHVCSQFTVNSLNTDRGRGRKGDGLASCILYVSLENRNVRVSCVTVTQSGYNNTMKSSCKV